MPEILSEIPSADALPPAAGDAKAGIRATQFSLTTRQINALLPWALIGCSAVIVLIALILHFRS